MNETSKHDSDQTMLAPSRAYPNALAPGTRLGEFEITCVIGQGGFGIVYLARDNSLGRDVALKEYMPAAFAGRHNNSHVTMLSEHYAETFKVGLNSFVNEAQLLAKFDHPSLVKVYRFWEDNGTGYMAMPFYDAPTLKQLLKGEHSALSEEGWLKHFLGHVLDALQVLHDKQCYHRDIAPDNILMIDGSKPLLLDFGAARRVIGDMTQALTVILKPGYAPIEQYGDMTNVTQGPWTDLYALASVVYFIITDKVPQAALSRLVSDTMEPLSLQARDRYSPQFLEALDAALAVRPEHRPQSVAQFREMLGLAGSHEARPVATADANAAMLAQGDGVPTQASASGHAARTAEPAAPITAAPGTSRHVISTPIISAPVAAAPVTVAPIISAPITATPLASSARFSAPSLPPYDESDATIVPMPAHTTLAPEDAMAPPPVTAALDLDSIVPPVEAVAGEQRPPSTPYAQADGATAATPAAPRKNRLAVAAGAALVLTALGASVFWTRPRPQPAAPPVAAVAPAPAPAPVAPAAPACALKLADGKPACPVMVAIPGGSYRKGSMPGDAGAATEEFGATSAPIAPFEISAHEVSVEQWQLCVDDGDCSAITTSADASGKLPVTGVSWDAAQNFIGWLSKKTGTPYRLPNEAEWEYAARAGSVTPFPWGEKIGHDNAHCGQCGSHLPISGPAPVGSFKDSNSLYDMVGNVYEWVEDCWYGSYADAPSSPPPQEALTCKKRVQKGGAYDSTESDVRPVARTWGDRGSADARVGFRVAR
jgi:formylglycine-generating enzyme required for sulfatase activity/serine/threonine protein kinase